MANKERFFRNYSKYTLDQKIVYLLRRGWIQDAHWLCSRHLDELRKREPVLLSCIQTLDSIEAYKISKIKPPDFPLTIDEVADLWQIYHVEGI
jgi:hypothetical protein